MSKIHNLVYDMQEQERKEEYGDFEGTYVSPKAKALVERIEYLKWERSSLMLEIKDVYRQYKEEMTK
jgi:uncharacterized protein (UPF0335 family)